MYAQLFHGRTNPKQDMEDWGFEGPVIGPTDFGMTYGQLRIFDELGDMEFFPMVEGCIQFGDAYYGDVAFLDEQPEGVVMSAKDAIKYIREHQEQKNLKNLKNLKTNDQVES